MQVKKQHLQLDMDKGVGLKLGKDFVKAIVRILSPCLFNFYAEYIMKNAGLDESQADWNQDFQEKY